MLGRVRGKFKTKQKYHKYKVIAQDKLALIIMTDLVRQNDQCFSSSPTGKAESTIQTSLNIIID